MDKKVEINSDPFEKLLRNADFRKNIILQLKSIQEANLISSKKYFRRARVFGSIFGLLVSLGIFNVSMEQIFQIPFEINQTMMIISGFFTLFFLLSGVCWTYQSDILTTQIKMLQLADYVDARNNSDSGNT
jgi:hypothetical protein